MTLVPSLICSRSDSRGKVNATRQFCAMVLGSRCFRSSGRLIGTLTLASAMAATPPVDVVVCLDNSGSMRQNDPHRLLPGAVLALTKALPSESQLGLVIFDRTASVTVPLTLVNSSGFASTVAAGLQNLDYRGQRTDIPNGLESAIYELREHGRDNASHAVILLTDGYIDTGDRIRDEERGRWLRNDLVPQLARMRVMVLGVAFTDQADFQLMQTLSANTGGVYFKARSSSDLTDIFGKIEFALQRGAAVDGAVVGPPSSARPVVIARGARPSLLWLGLSSVAVLISVAALAVLLIQRRRRYPFHPSLHDQGGHTGTAVHYLRFGITRVGCVRRPSWRNPNHIVLPYPTVSRQHAELYFESDSVALADSGSTNHTYRNGKKLAPGSRITLHTGDVIRFDAYEFRFVAGGQHTILAQGNEAQHQHPEPELAPIESNEVNPGTPGTLVKPVFCANHEGAKPEAQCPICEKVFCARCLDTWANHRICATCRDLISSASADDVQQILMRLGRIGASEDPTLVKPE